MSDDPRYIDPNQFCSPARRFLLRAHGAYIWCWKQVCLPVVTLLNTIDSTPQFAKHLALLQEQERYVARLAEIHRHRGGRIMM